MKAEKLLLAVCLALSPARSRAVRKEQWAADLMDCTELGISRNSLLYGALRASASARVHDTIHRAGKKPSQTIKGKNMRAATATLGVALTLAVGCFVGIQSLPTGHDLPQATQTTNEYGDRDKSASVDSSSLLLPSVTITVNAATDNVPEAFSQARKDGNRIKLVSDQRYSVTVDPSWPMESISIMDPETGDILDTFPMKSIKSDSL